jgi:peptidoglycan/LPS O-acetylase OafA/YrhL
MHFFASSNGFWNAAAGYFMLFGLGIFVFISGFLIDLNYSRKISRCSDILVFYKYRAIRILPLNWIAVISFLLFSYLLVPALFPSFGFQYPTAGINILSVFSQFIGLELLIQNSGSFLWFVSFVVICYLVYPILIKFSKNPLHLVIISILPLLAFGFLRLIFGLIDDRFFLYYLVFVGGILTNKYVKDWNRSSNKKLALFLALTLSFSFIYLWKGGQLLSFNVPFINFAVRQMIIFNISIVTGCIFLLFLLNKRPIFSLLNKYSTIITFLAVSSYCVYLFHFQFFTIGAGLIEVFKLPTIVNDVLFYLLVIPITFVISYYTQIKEEKLTKTVKGYYLSILLRKKVSHK